MVPVANTIASGVNKTSNEEEDEDEEKKKKKEEEERDKLLAMLPPHCLAFKTFVTRSDKKPTPPRVMEASECFQSCPKIIPRSEWQARPPNKPPEHMMYRVRAAVFKETDVPNCDNRDDCLEVVRMLQSFQMEYLNFNDIAYSFLIGEDGNIYEGRGWCLENEKAQGFSGIGYIGYHAMEPLEEPSDIMLQATYDLIMCGVRKGFINNPFEHGVYAGDTPIEMVKEFIKGEEDVDYRSRPEDMGMYYRRPPEK